jgi:hypothetical protein
LPSVYEAVPRQVPATAAREEVPLMAVRQLMLRAFLSRPVGLLHA